MKNPCKSTARRACQPLRLNKSVIRKRPQKRHQRVFIRGAQRDATVGMLRKIRVESRAAFHAGAIMLHGFLQRAKPSVVHVRPVQRNVAQRGHREFPAIAFALRHFETSLVPEFRIQSIVRKTLALEQRAAVAMKTIRAVLPVIWIVFGVEQLKPALLLRRERSLAQRTRSNFESNETCTSRNCSSARASRSVVTSGEPKALAKS